MKPLLSANEREFLRRSKSAAQLKDVLNWSGIFILAIIASIMFGLWRQTKQALAKASDATEATKAQLLQTEAANDAKEKALEAASAAKATAEEALVRYFLRTVGTSNASPPSTDEQESLWDLATLESSNLNVRRELLRRWTESEDFFLRASSHGFRGVWSAIGLSSTLGEEFAGDTSNMAARLTDVLLDPKPIDSARLDRVAVSLIDSLWWIDQAATARVAKHLAAALAEPPEWEFGRFSPVARVLAAYVALLDSTNTASIAEGLTKALEADELKGPDNLRLLALSRVLVAFPASDVSINATSLANRAASKILSRMDASQTRFGARLDELAHSLAAFLPRMDEADAAPMAERGSQILLAAMERAKTEPETILKLASPLASLTSLGKSSFSVSLAEKGAEVVLTAMEEANLKTETLLQLADRLAALTSVGRSGGATFVAGKGASVVSNAFEGLLRPDTGRLPFDCTDRLVALAPRMDTNAASSMAREETTILALWMGDRRDTLAWRWSEASKAIGALAPHLVASDADSAAGILIDSLEKLPDRVYERRSGIAAALVHLVPRVSPDHATNLVRQFFQSLVTPGEAADDRASANGTVLTALGARLNTNQSAFWAEQLVMAMESPRATTVDRVLGLARALVAFTARMETNAASSVAARGVRVLSQLLESSLKLSSDSTLDVAARVFTSLAAYLNPADAETAAKRMVMRMESAHVSDTWGLWTCGEALSASLKRTNPEFAPTLSARAASVLIDLIERERFRSFSSIQVKTVNALELLLQWVEPDVRDPLVARLLDYLAKEIETLPGKTDTSSMILEFSTKLAALAPRLGPQHASSMIGRAAAALILPSPNPQYYALAVLAAELPGARRTRLLALSNLFVDGIQPQSQDGSGRSRGWVLAERICSGLDKSDLVDALKWPFCVGGARNLVLDALEKQLQPKTKFEGFVSRFIEQAPMLGFPGDVLDQSATRPQAADATAELKSIMASASVKLSPPVTTPAR